MLASTLKAGSVGQRPVLRHSYTGQELLVARDGVRIAVWSDGCAPRRSIGRCERPRRLDRSITEAGQSRSPACLSMPSADGSSRLSRNKGYRCGT